MKRQTNGPVVISMASRRGAQTAALGMLLILAGLAIPRLADAASWQPVGSMFEARNQPTVTLLTDGTVLVAGGRGQVDNRDVSLASAERFDPKTNTFTAASPMQVGRWAASAVRLQGGRVLVLGGYDDKIGALASAEVFDPGTGTFSRVGDMVVPRAGATATLLPDGRVLVVGDNGGTRSSMRARAELFDPTTGKFQETGPLLGTRGDHAAVGLPDGRVVIVGGLDIGKLNVLRRVEIYNPASGTFLAQGETAVERGAPSATLLPNGRILIAGGYFRPNPPTSENIRNSVEIYDPATGQSTITGTLGGPRVNHVAVSLSDGRVLLAGGFRNETPQGPLRSSELIDPTAGQASPTEPMSIERVNAAGVLLPDGRVLVVGGFPQFEASPLATAEAYVP
jgi:hypothetical protein